MPARALSPGRSDSADPGTTVDLALGIWGSSQRSSVYRPLTPCSLSPYSCPLSPLLSLLAPAGPDLPLVQAGTRFPVLRELADSPRLLVRRLLPPLRRLPFVPLRIVAAPAVELEPRRGSLRSNEASASLATPWRSHHARLADRRQVAPAHGPVHDRGEAAAYAPPGSRRLDRASPQ